MSVPEYSAGSWTAVVRPGFVALLGPGAADSTVRALWQDSGEGVFAALALLARDGFGGLPPFAVVSVDGQRVHAALRGDVEVVVEVGGRTDVWRSGEVSTWTERVLDGVAGVVVQADDAADGSRSLPLADGIAAASRVQVSLTAGDQAAPAPAVAAPVVVPEPAAPETPVEEPLEEPVVVDSVTWDEPTQVELVPVSVEHGHDDEDEVVEVPVPAEPSDVVAAAESFLVSPVDPPSTPTPTHPVPVGGASLDDHDGLTILSTDLAEIREQLPSWASDDVPGPFRATPVASAPARLVLSTGLVVPLDRAVLLGRAPQVARVTNRELPRLITVPSPQQDISRTHAEVRVDGDQVVVTDLDSTNGIHVARAGEGSRRLHPGEPSVVAADEVVDLGDGVTFSVERGS
jgi:hypothetical protein